VIEVLVVDDQQLVRNAVAELVVHEPDMQVVGRCENGVEAVRMATSLEPDVVVMDVRMPIMDGIEATRIISQDLAQHGVRVLILTTFEDDADYVVRGVRAGAAGFVSKGAEPEVIIEAIRTVQRGEGLLSPRATKTLLDEYAGSSASRGALHADLQSLTARELEILRLVAAGRTNQEIAEHFGISVVTVKTHINRTMAKVDCHDRAQLVLLAIETGLVTPRLR